MNWRVILAVVIALAVGAGGGALAEHQRLKDKSNKPSAASHSTTTTTAGLLGTQRTAACPAVLKWYAALGRSTYDAASHLSWADEKRDLVAQQTVIVSSFGPMLRVVPTSTRAELEDLSNSETAVQSALIKATSAAEFAQAQKALTTARLTRIIGLLVADARACSKKA